MDAKTSKTLNIRLIVAEKGGPSAFAKAYPGPDEAKPRDQSQVSQWISETNPKGIGHKLARQLEVELGLPNGALDYHPYTEAVAKKKKGKKDADWVYKLTPAQNRLADNARIIATQLTDDQCAAMLAVLRGALGLVPEALARVDELDG